MTNAATVANASNTIRWRPRNATPTALRRSSPSTRDKSAQPPPWTQEEPMLGPNARRAASPTALRILGAGARWNRRPQFLYRNEARPEKRPSRKRGDRSSPQRPAIVFRDGARHVRDDRQAGSGRGWFACRLIRPSAW